MITEIKEMNFKLYFILMKLNLNPVCPVVAMLAPLVLISTISIYRIILLLKHSQMNLTDTHHLLLGVHSLHENFCIFSATLL